jgi:hypothetical protein
MKGWCQPPNCRLLRTVRDKVMITNLSGLVRMMRLRHSPMRVIVGRWDASFEKPHNKSLQTYERRAMVVNQRDMAPAPLAAERQNR